MHCLLGLSLILVILTASPAKTLDTVPELIQVWVLDEPQMCSGQFAAHDLDHVTTVPGGDDVRMFEANGAGVGIHDLDSDDDMDIVLANHAGPNSILWNEGQLTFRTQRMQASGSRSVNLIDFNADSLIDLFFTRVASAPNLWLNQGEGRFAREFVPGLAEPLYTTTWADLNGDDTLDLVGATYDAALLSAFGQDFLVNSKGGVYVYGNREQRLSPTRLAVEAQALALLLADINNDQRLDILVGNDFAVPDFTWIQTESGWEAVDSFSTISHSTMSLDSADVNNNGQNEIFSTDMKPYRDDEITRAAWEPVIGDMNDEQVDDTADPQIASNVIEVRKDGIFQDEAPERGIDATGWSWSGKFGDLDQDGFVDLYVVNGMIEKSIFAHLPDHELVEENQALRNDGSGRFAPAPEWGLASTRSGRGMSMADLDGDGDLDIVINNLRGAAQLFENQLCTGRSLLVDLRLPNSGNTYAIGARLSLHTSEGIMHRDVHVGSGYLSSDPARVHFGFPESAALEGLEIEWPNGVITWIDKVRPQTRLMVTRF